MSVRKSTRALAAFGTVAALAIAGCGGGGGTASPTTSGNQSTGASTQKASIGTDAAGPAPEVAGATKGGTLHVLMASDFDHLDPQRSYVNIQGVTGRLLYRALTTFKDTPDGLVLIPDLASDTGKTDDGGKTWTFTLRDGVKWQDGSAVTSKDVKYGVERAFSDQITDGPTYIQEWLAGTPDFGTVYPGPYKAPEGFDAITTPDDKTVVFHLKEAHLDFPYAASLTTTAPVPQAHDTKDQYDTGVWSNGPYKIENYQRGKLLTLVRNDQWDPKTDPIRNAYPDKFVFDIGIDSQVINERLIADQGDDQAAVTWSSVPTPLIPKVLDDPAVKARSMEYQTQYVEYMNINMDRVKDLKVREALLYAFDRQSYRLTIGGSTAGDFATTLSSPTTPGFEAYDLFNVPPTGDVEKAKALLKEAGNEHPTIVYGHADTPKGTKSAVAVKAGLERAGFNVTLKTIPADAYYSTIGKVDNAYDMYRTGWGSDWPGYSTIVPPLWDGRKIQDGASNYSHINDAAINSAIDDAQKTAGADQNKKFLEVEKSIMKQVPAIPTIYIKWLQVNGSKIGNAHTTDNFGAIELINIFVKQ